MMRLEKLDNRSQPLQQIEQTHQRHSQHKDSITDRKNGSETEQIISKGEVKTAVTNLNSFLEPFRTNLKFEFHEELNEYYVTVVNPITNEMIKEIPPKKMLDMYAEMAGFMGILIDKKI